MFHHLVCLVSFILAVRELRALPPCPAKGGATEDVLLQNGSSFTMSCNLTDAEEGLTIGIRKEETWLSSVNSSRVVVWKKDYVQGDDRAIYYCVVRGDHCGPTPFSATSLAVAYAPLKPTKHWCIGHNLETFTCYWSIPKIWTNTTYRVLLRVGTEEVHSVIICEDTLVWDAANVTCRLVTAGGAIYRIEEKTFHFTVQANNTFGGQQWEYEVDHFRNVHLSAPTGVMCQPSKDSIYVTWDGLPEVSSFPPVHYRVEVADHPQLTRNVTGENYSTITDGPVPYIRYDVTVRAKFDQSDTWSPGSGTITCTTSKDRPTAVPKVTANGFSIENYKEARNVRVYFQGVPKELWHGEEMRYVIVLLDGKGGHTIVATNRSDYELRELSHNKGYTARIYSENEVGRSAGYATLTIPATNRLLPPVEGAYIDASQVWSVRLHVREGEDMNATYTLFWRCGREEKVALESLSWKELSKRDKKVDVASDPSSCVYAIASQKGGQVSPMTWIDCVTPKSREYEELLSGTDRVFAAEVTDSSIRLAFLSKCNPLVATRQIHYHAATDESYKLITLEDEKEVTIPELSSKTNYVVSISSFLEDGRVVFHEQLRLKTRSRALLMVAIGLCVGFLLFVIVGCILVAWCRRFSAQFVKYKTATVEVLVPADFSQITSDSSSDSQSSQAPLLASEQSQHTTPYLDNPNEQEGTITCDAVSSQSAYSHVTGLGRRSNYVKVSDMILPLEDEAHSNEVTFGDTDRRTDIHSSTALQPYYKLCAPTTSQQQNSSSQEPTVGFITGYSSCFTPPRYFQLSVEQVNEPEDTSMQRPIPNVTGGYVPCSSRPYSKISATIVSEQRDHIQTTADAAERCFSSSSSQKEASKSPIYFELPDTSASQPEEPRSREPVADGHGRVPPYLKLSAMLASEAQNPTPPQPVVGDDGCCPSEAGTSYPPPYFRLSAMIANQPQHEVPVQEFRNWTTTTCSETPLQQNLAGCTEALPNCASEPSTEQACEDYELRDVGYRRRLWPLAETESDPELPGTVCHTRNLYVEDNRACLLDRSGQPSQDRGCPKYVIPQMHRLLSARQAAS
ncbi:uncharacterized protein LOC135390922 isoform X2 [Ornithodoros turicata]|uniref:uncharacterized protein LOC135390922 isoform X2 n=1 Tax=Ornithodoros turicata TaxID=34597 RepID=UPI003138B770